MDRNDLILVTGASGFIGGRLVELLAERGFRVRAAISNASKLDRISRLDVELLRADLTDHAALSHAVAGCSVIFHVAYRFGGSASSKESISTLRAPLPRCSSSMAAAASCMSAACRLTAIRTTAS